MQGERRSPGTHLEQRQRSADVHFVIINRNLTALADRLERREVDDGVDAARAILGILGENIVDRFGIPEVDGVIDGLRGVFTTKRQ